MTTQEIDTAKAAAFAGQMVGVLNGGMLSLMLSIGHQTGLLDKMGALPPSTSADIAKAAGLNERYVREWLGAMVTGRVVDYDPATQTYHLPPEHAAAITRAAGTNNLGTMAQFIAHLGKVEEGIVHAFRNGGGVPYSAFENFHAIMKEQSAQVFDGTLIDLTLPLVDGLVARLEQGIDVADVGCGSGHAINLMAKAFPKSRFVGYDFSEEAIAAGKAEAKSMNLANAEFEVKDAATLDGSRQFDFITTFDSVHDQAQPRRVLKGIADSLRPGGTYLCVDIAASSDLHENMDHPLGPALYSISTMHCMTVSLALDGEGLGTAWGEQLAKQLMTEAGFKKIDVKQVEGDIMNNFYIATKE